MKISAHYSQFKWLLSQLPLEKDRYSLESSHGHDYNGQVEALEKDINQDLSRYKTKFNFDYDKEGLYTSELRTKLGSLIGFLEGEYDLGDTKVNQQNNRGLHVSVINQNTIAITVNQTIQELIENAGSEEEKKKLEELNEEIKKPGKDWGKVKPILVWILNFSEKLFFQVLPVLLKHYGAQ